MGDSLSVQMFHVKHLRRHFIAPPRPADQPTRRGAAGVCVAQFCTICCVSSAFGRPRAPPGALLASVLPGRAKSGFERFGSNAAYRAKLCNADPAPPPPRPPPPAGQPPPASPRSHPPRRLAPASLPVNSSKNVIRPITFFLQMMVQCVP